MTTFERFEGDLPMLLEELAPPRTPDYLDSVFGRTARARQRPAWTFLERWLPMSALTERMATVPRFQLRFVVLLALLLAALAAAAVYVGSRQSRPLPAPFGPAANGLIPFVSSGDIYLGDPTTGDRRLLVGGPAGDALPGFSPDGTRVAFIRDVRMPNGEVLVEIYVVRDDGSDFRRITPEPIADYSWITWTPDGQHVAAAHQVEGVKRLDLFDADGGGAVKTIATGEGIDGVEFRPPDGRELIYRDIIDGKNVLVAVDADGSNPRTLIVSEFGPDMGLDLGNAVYSGDGGRIFFQRAGTAPNPDDGCCRLWVMNADGSGAHEFVPPTGRAWDGQARVSPDGSRVAFWRAANETNPISVVRADGTGPVVETGPKLTGTASFIWAPDSSKILMYPSDASSASAYLLDPDGGPWTTVPWTSDADLDWQRVAPAP